MFCHQNVVLHPLYNLTSLTFALLNNLLCSVVIAFCLPPATRSVVSGRTSVGKADKGLASVCWTLTGLLIDCEGVSVTSLAWAVLEDWEDNKFDWQSRSAASFSNLTARRTSSILIPAPFNELLFLEAQSALCLFHFYIVCFIRDLSVLFCFCLFHL